MQLAGYAFALAHVLADPDFLPTIPQDGFNLRIAFKALGKAVHLAFDLAARLVVLPAAKLLALPLQFLPAFNEAVGPHIRVGLHRALLVQPLDDLADALPAGKLGQAVPHVRVVLQRRPHQVARARPHLVELLAGLAHFLALRIEDRKPVALLPVGGFIGAGVAVNGLLKRRLRPQTLGKPVLRRRRPQAPFPFRPFSRLLGSPTVGPRTSIEPQPVEHAAPLLRAILGPFLGQLVAIRRGRPLGRRAPRQFQALEPAAALLSIVGKILARICTKILREIRADFLRGSTIKRMIPGRRLPLRT